MTHNYRHQNESGRWQDHPRASQRGGAGRDHYESGNERRYRPDWEERSYESGSQNDTGFEGDRSYAAGGYPEEFGYRRDNVAERERGYQQRFGGTQSGRDEHRFSGSYYDRPFARHGMIDDYEARDFGQGGPLRSSGQRHDFSRDEEFSRGRNDYAGSGFYGGGNRNYYGSQAGSQRSPSGYGSQGSYAGGIYGHEYGGDRQAGEFGRLPQQQSYRGRGPKGYERSDERLREIVCERLTDDPSIDACEVTVEVTGKVVKLSGMVDDRRTKYLIEELIEQVGGVRDIDNQVRVQPSSQSSTSPYGTSSDNTFGGRSINVGQSGNIGQSSPQTPSPAKRN